MQGRKLYVFDRHGIRHEAPNNEMLAEKKSQCFSLAISPDGTTVALAWGTIVQIYRFINGSLKLISTVGVHRTNERPLVKYQKMNFSADSSQLIVATQEDFGVHHDAVYLRVWDCSRDNLQSRWRPQGFRITKVLSLFS
jgi:hypothetical protein